jgi:translation initiation factor IF-2
MIIKKPPVVAVMGHIDHGKSTLLSYIRNSQKEILGKDKRRTSKRSS